MQQLDVSSTVSTLPLWSTSGEQHQAHINVESKQQKSMEDSSWFLMVLLWQSHINMIVFEIDFIVEVLH